MVVIAGRATRGAHLERLGHVGAHEGDGAEVVEDLDEHAVDFGNAAYPSRVACGGRSGERVRMSLDRSGAPMIVSRPWRQNWSLREMGRP